MNLYILDKNFNPLSILENYNSLRWLEEYNGDGEFQLICNYTNENVNFLVQNNFIWKNDSDTIGIIELLNIKDDVLEIRGKLANKVLMDRIVLNDYVINGNLELELRKIVDLNCIKRNPIPFLQLGDIKNLKEEGNIKTEYNEVGTIFKKFKDIGYKTKFDYENKLLKLELYKGEDKTIETVFCEEFENIFNQIINLDNSNYKNVAYVYGEKVENKEQKSVIIDLSNGNLRKEIYVDATDITQDESEYDQDGNLIKPAITDEEYIKLLEQRGNETLADLIETKAFKCDIVTDGMFKYKIDYNLGDFVTCRSDKYKVKFKTMITAVQEIYTIEGYQVVATLGELNKEDYYG